MTTAQLIVLGAGLAASGIDLRSRRVPNLLTMPLACAGVLLAAAGATGLTVADAALGCLVGLGLMLPLHILGGTGAGDVKLMAAFGAFLGPAGVFAAFIRMALIGGVTALGVAVQRGRLRETLNGTALLVARVDGVAEAIAAPAMHNRFPYAPAVAVGAAMVVLGW
jgi:prepilin peptidase CpaA